MNPFFSLKSAIWLYWFINISSDGLLISFGKEKKDLQTLKVDSIIICAGQISEIFLVEKLNINKIDHHIIGGAKVANELDDKKCNWSRL